MARGRIVFVDDPTWQPAVWVVSEKEKPDLDAVDALARLRLAARRLGGSVDLREITTELAELFDLVGLRRELGGEAESCE